jgi:hypothetical protein
VFVQTIELKTSHFDDIEALMFHDLDIVRER